MELAIINGTYRDPSAKLPGGKGSDLLSICESSSFIFIWRKKLIYLCIGFFIILVLLLFIYFCFLFFSFFFVIIYFVLFCFVFLSQNDLTFVSTFYFPRCEIDGINVLEFVANTGKKNMAVVITSLIIHSKCVITQITLMNDKLEGRPIHQTPSRAWFRYYVRIY